MVAPGFDPHAPPPPARSTYESVRLLGERRAELTRRIAAWLDAHGGPPAVAPDRRDAPLIDRARALAIAQEALVELERDLTVPLAIWDGDPDVEPVTDHGDVWVVMWNSVEYLRTKDFYKQQLVGPIVIPKDGAGWFNPPTGRSIEAELDEWRQETGRSDPT